MAILNKLHDRYMIYLALIVAFVGTLSKSIRPPNDWAEGHWLINYDIGFVKRGLPGTLLNLFSVTESPITAETAIAVVSYILFAVFMLTLFFVTWRVLQCSKWQIPFALYTVLFATSSFVVMTANIIGYYDHIFHAGTIIAIWLVLKKRFLFALIIITVLLLVHESVIVVGLPPIALAFVLTNKQFSKEAILILVVPVVLLILLVLYQGSFDNASVYEILVARLESYPFIELDRHIIVPQAYTTSFTQYLVTQMPRFPQRILNSELSLRVYPYLFATLMMLVYGYGIKIRSWRFGFIIFSILAPLSLHLIAWDVQRIWTYTIFNAFLVVWICTEIYEARSIPAPQITVTFLFTLLIQVYGETPLVEGEESIVLNLIRPIILAMILYGLLRSRPVRRFLLVDGLAGSPSVLEDQHDLGAASKDVLDISDQESEKQYQDSIR